MPTYGFGYLQMKDKRAKGQASTSDLLSQDIGQVTDRSQIINPNDVVNPDNYGLGRRERLRYESDLAQAKLYAEQQEAAYQEWFDSPEQQAVRQRAAGLNPDLIGVEQSQSADVQQAESSPMTNIPTNAEIAFSAVSAISNLVGSLSGVASLSTAFAQIPLIKKQVESQDLSNLKDFESLAYSAIADRVSRFISSADGQTVDLSSFFSDDSNFDDILSSYAPSNDPRYSSILNRIRTGSQSIFQKAYETASKSGQFQTSFAEVLSNPYYNPDVKLQAAMLMPVAEMFEDLRKYKAQFESDVLDMKKEYMNNLDIPDAAAAFNSSNLSSSARSEYDRQFYQAMDPQLKARYIQYREQAEARIAMIRAAMDTNLFSMYSSNPVEYSSQAALYLYLAGASMHWEDFAATQAVNIITDGHGKVVDQALFDKYEAYWNEQHKSVTGVLTPSLEQEIIEDTKLMFGD